MKTLKDGWYVIKAYCFSTCRVDQLYDMFPQTLIAYTSSYIYDLLW